MEHVGPSAGAPVFAGAKAYHSTTQSLTNNTLTASSLDTEDYDTDAIHDTVTNNTRFTVPSNKAGKWRFVGYAMFAANTTGVRVLQLRLNGVTIIRGSRRSNEGEVGTTQSFATEADVSLSVADYVELVAFQSSGAGLNIGTAGDENATSLWAQFLG